MSSELYDLLYAQYHKHFERVYGPVQQDPRRVWRRTLRSYERTYHHLIRGLPQGARILDIGCGTGILLKWLMDYHPQVIPVGVDQSAEEIELARSALPKAALYVDDALRFLQTHQNSFYGIFAHHIIEHIADELLLDWLRAIYGALRPGGFFCCRVPNAANIMGLYHRYDDLTHCRVFADHSLLQLMDIGAFENATIVPIKPGWLIAAMRQLIEALLHRCIFLISGHPNRIACTTEVCAVGYRRAQ